MQAPRALQPLKTRAPKSPSGLVEAWRSHPPRNVWSILKTGPWGTFLALVLKFRTIRVQTAFLSFLQNTLVLLPLRRCKIGFSSLQRIFLSNSHPASLLLNARQPALTVRQSKTQTRASPVHTLLIAPRGTCLSLLNLPLQLNL